MPNPEIFTREERRLLEPYFTNLDERVFALTNLPEVVKGALFARYSRSPKSLRRLFLDEFIDTDHGAAFDTGAGLRRARELYDRVFIEFGDDSVAQLGGAHLAVEGASNILTKILERGRLMSYLEQSTRYIPFTSRLDGRWRYCIPPELENHPARKVYIEVLDEIFETYTEWVKPLQELLSTRFPQGTESVAVHHRTLQAKALDILRGLLPAATTSNLGLFGSGQAFESLLLRMRAHPSAEARETARLMLHELRKVIPEFLKRVDQEERGVVWSRYLSETREETERMASEFFGEDSPLSKEEKGPAEKSQTVQLTDFDPEGEIKVIAAALYSTSNLPDGELLARVRRMPHEDRVRVLKAYVGSRRNRRHRPGRAFERTSYRFDILSDYGAFRDLQRHRILSIEWQQLTTHHGYHFPQELEASPLGDRWHQIMTRSSELFHRLAVEGLERVASYAVCMAYRIRYYMEMNAREAMHLIELRTAPQGHTSYRLIGQEMHRLIAETAGHRAIAEAISFADHTSGEEGRLSAEMSLETRRTDHGSILRLEE